MKLTYAQKDGYLLPNLLPPQESEVHLGKYALLRRTFLKKHRRILFTNLLTTGKLNEHLMEVDKTANERMDFLTKQLAQQYKVTEEMKASNQMKWVMLMNNIKSTAEETVLQELVYS